VTATVEELVEEMGMLLDDPWRHALCASCYPPGSVPEGGLFVGLCGTLALRKPLAGLAPGTIPVDACRDCAALVHVPCARCSGDPADLDGP
jgi:hypothetical protein